jgi:hypothetical protein
MGRIKEFLSIKPHSTSCPQGLRKLSPDLISKARDETATQVSRIGLTFVGTAAFCLLSLLSPDSALLGGNERISVPFAGPVSFFGFMLLGPAVLIALRVYLQIYVEHSDRLDRLARSVSAPRAPTLVPLQNPLLRLFGGLTFYTLLPVTLTRFALKAAVFPAWGSVLFGVAVAAIASHVMLPCSRYSWQLRGVLSVSAALVAGAVAYDFKFIHRPFDLHRANLSGQLLAGEDLHKADLRNANLKGADLLIINLNGANLIAANLSNANLDLAKLNNAKLVYADLTGAYLFHADLQGADLGSANLSGAHLEEAFLKDAQLIAATLTEANLKNADLTGAILIGANLTGAKLTGANLTGADLRELPNFELIHPGRRQMLINPDRRTMQTQLDEACGDANTKLPEGLTVKPCETR